MRWLVAILGVIGLAGAVYFGMEPRLRRPTLRVALNLRAGDPDDAALAAGVALALDERDERAGRYRVKAAHQIVQPNGSIDTPRPAPHTLLYGLEAPVDPRTDGGDGPTPPVDAAREATALLAWMRERSLTRLALPLPHAPRKRLLSKGEDEARTPTELERAAPAYDVETFAFPHTGNLDALSAAILAARPHAVHLHSGYRRAYHGMRRRLRLDGFEGSVFIASESVTRGLWSLEDFFVVLAPLKTAPPPDFLQRHAHPFAYAGYRGTLRYLDALDANPKADPMALARTFPRWSAFDELQDEPRVYVIRSGRFHPAPAR